ncbi:MAG: polyprenyl synthetase family protein [Acidobacteria bacterium]|nr:polyprenyl synthetase family protein [Acidobacteriota bacterium]
MKSAPGALLSTQEIFRLVEPDLSRVELHLKEKAASPIPLVNHVSNYVREGGGKRLRPALLLLSSKLCGYEGEAGVHTGAVVELIHAATLVHDDIIDEARLRRGRASVNARWGNQITVLMGDWLYMTSFQMALQLRDFSILDVLIEVTRKMIEGELLQLQFHGRTDISAGDQLEICFCKTASLFAACGRIGALLGRVNESQQEKLRTYGQALGMAFQLTDDLLDYTSSESILGKPVLKDLEGGKVTLPIIYLFERADFRHKDFINETIRKQDFSPTNKRRIIELVNDYGTLQDTFNLAMRYADQARESLQDFPDSVYRDALLRIPEFVVRRKK